MVTRSGLAGAIGLSREAQRDWTAWLQDFTPVHDSDFDAWRINGRD